MLPFHKLKNLLFLFISVCLYINFAVKLGFVVGVLAIMFTTKVWCPFHPHSSYQSFNGNCTTVTKGLSHIGR